MGRTGTQVCLAAQGTARRSVRRGVSEKESRRRRNDADNIVLNAHRNSQATARI